MAKGNTVGEVLLRLGLDSSGFNNELKNVKNKTGGLSSTVLIAETGILPTA